jgi:hypothetical protein
MLLRLAARSIRIEWPVSAYFRLVRSNVIKAIPAASSKLNKYIHEAGYSRQMTVSGWKSDRKIKAQKYASSISTFLQLAEEFDWSGNRFRFSNLVTARCIQPGNCHPSLLRT